MDAFFILSFLLITAPTGIVGSSEGPKSICEICSCADTAVNCRNVRLKKSFDPHDWLPVEKSNVTEVVFDNNYIGHITKFPKLPLVKLSFNNNRVVKIDDRAFKNLTSLKELYLGNNELTSSNLLPSVFEGPFDSEYYEPLNIVTLDLSGNELHTLHQDLFEHLPFLQRLYLKRNPFKILDKPTVIAISSLPNLQILDLSFTKIKELPPGFLHTPRKLHELVLKGNFFSDIPSDALTEAPQLNILNLNENPMKILSSERPFPPMPSLTQLHISFMPNLTRIEAGSLSNLTNLQYLDCRMNDKLVHISPSAFTGTGNEKKSPAMLKLDLSDNGLKYLDKELIEPSWSTLKELNILGNPLVCDCENQWIVSDLIPLMINIHSPVDGLQCEEPEAMKGQRLLSLHAKNYSMRCLDLYGAHPENDGPILISIFVIVILCLILALIVVIWMKNNNTCRKGGRVNYQRAFYRPTSLDDPEKY